MNQNTAIMHYPNLAEPSAFTATGIASAGARQSSVESLVGKLLSEVQCAQSDLNGLEEGLSSALSPPAPCTNDASPRPAYGAPLAAALDQIFANVEALRRNIQDIARRSEL